MRAAEKALAERRQALAGREAAAETAEAELDAARHADMVSALSAGLKVGDPCPVCGEPLGTLPTAPGSRGLAKATVALERARSAVTSARTEASGAERTAQAAHHEVESAARDATHRVDRIAELDRTAEAARAALVAVLGDPLPADPPVEVERRLGERH